MVDESCSSEVGLEFLAEGMAKQYDDYQSALQELVDNAVSGTVKSESYFKSPDKSVQIEISIIREEESVRTIVADSGPGISRQALREDVFRTGNTSVSEGILNNVGWGLKASLAWFESTLSQLDEEEPEWFELITQTAGEDPTKVVGPITGDLPLVEPADDEWSKGIIDPEGALEETDHGTRIHVSCSRERFDDDVWAAGDKLELKIQSLRERLGHLFRRLLSAKSENRMIISYRDIQNGSMESYEILPIFPTYKDPDSSEEYGSYDFTVENAEGNIFDISYEKGTLDFQAMREQYEKDAPELFTSGGNFRTRYRPSQAKQGIDIYANGRILMTSVFSDIFELTRNNQYNYFGGTLRIIPREDSVEVPTDNKKTRVDTSSVLWSNIQEILSNEPYIPVGKSYETDLENSDEIEDEEIIQEEVSGSKENLINGSNIDSKSIFGMHKADSRHLKDHLGVLFNNRKSNEGLVDLTITSPPYADVKNYATGEEDQIGLGDTYAEYLEELRDIFAQVYDITAEDGSLWLVANTFKKNGEVYNLPWDIASQLQNLDHDRFCPDCSTEAVAVPLVKETSKGPYQCVNCDYSTNTDGSWQLQDIVIWDKTRALPYSQDGKLRNVFEYMLLFSKSQNFKFDLDSIRIADPDKFKEWWVDFPERYHPRGKVPENIWNMVTPAQGSFGFESLNHPAPFPPQLVERMIRLSSNKGDTILDPFAGSGMVLAVADILDRKPIGFELSDQYIENYPAVRSEVQQKVGLNGSSSTSVQRDQLAKIIGGLRQTKHLKRILIHLAEEQNIDNPGELNIQTVFNISKWIDEGVSNPEAFIESEYIFIVDEGTTPARGAEMESMIHSIIHETDARTFGIQASAKVLTLNSIVAEQKQGLHPELSGKLFRYSDQHHRYENTLTFDQWRNNVNSRLSAETNGDRFPPVISNIGLNVQNPSNTDPKSRNDANPNSMYRSSDSELHEIVSLQEKHSFTD